jgi:UPF0042 nucleotide-binding protein
MNEVHGKRGAGGAASAPAPAWPGVRVIIVSGLSGAGKTIALRALEDSGYFCIDNLPATLLGPFLRTVTSSEKIRKIGIGMDIREKDFLSDSYRILSSLRKSYNLQILFFEADADVMVRRFRETRRPHPVMSFYKGMNIEKAIEEEKSLLSVIRDAADRVIDTSNYTPHQLRYMMTSSYGSGETSAGMDLSVMSFGFKFGAPQNADIIFDARFLPNPYFIAELKSMKGTDKSVSDFVLGSEDTKEFLGHIRLMLAFLMPRYIREERAYLVIGVGCTGGRHRSPALVEEIAIYIREEQGLTPNIIHRDME